MADAAYDAYIKKHFSVLAPFYDLIELLLFRLRKKVIMLAKPGKGAKVLDVATGTGSQAFAFAKTGCKVTGIDLSEDMLNIARKKNKYPDVRFRIADASSLPFKDQSFDICCISLGLHEMPPAVMRKTLAEMARVTKVNGSLMVTDYSLPENSIGRKIVYAICNLYESKYYPEFIKTNMKSLPEKSGFRIEKQLSIFRGAGIILNGVKNG